MRLHAITLENLNSLYGRHHVDVDNDLGGAPLFVIVGPTGAGKSTLLDAVSLALFGETPRLRNTRGSSSAGDARLVMSRGTAACFAQVEISLPTTTGRTRYRAGWAARRARGSSDGRLQTVRRTLERQKPDGGWQMLVASNLKKIWEPEFRDVFGDLDADTFRRTMLLPQGEFAALLKADVATKAGLLERLTNTGSFADVGARASAMKRAAEERLAITLAELRQVCDVTPEQARELEAELAAAHATTAELRKASDQLDQLCEWHARRRKLRSECETAAAELARVSSCIEAAGRDTDRLTRHQAVEPAAEASRLAAELRASADSLTSQLDVVTSALSDARAAVTEVETRHVEATRRVQEHHAASAELQPVIETARELRLRIASKRQEVGDSNTRASGAETRLATASRQTREVVDRREACQGKLASTHAQLAGFDGVDALSSALSGIQARVERVTRLAPRLQEADESASQLSMAREAAAQSVARAADDLTDQEELASVARSERERWSGVLRAALPNGAELDSWRSAFDVKAGRRGRDLERFGRAALLADQRSQADTEAKSSLAMRSAAQAEATEASQLLEQLAANVGEVESELVVTRARLEELTFAVGLIARRAILVDGDPCALCGSDEHPYRLDPTSVADHDAALSARHCRRQSELKALEQRLDRLRHDIGDCGQKQAHAHARREAADSQHRLHLARMVQLDKELVDTIGESRHPATSAQWLAAADSCREHLRRGERLRSFVDATYERVRAAQQRERDADAAATTATNRLAEHRARQSELERRARDLEMSRTALTTELDDAMASIRMAFQSAGIEVGDDVTECVAAITEAQRRISEHRGLNAHRDALNTTLQQLAADVAACEARQAAVVVEHSELTALATARANELAALVSQADGLLGGRSPDDVVAATAAALVGLEAHVHQTTADGDRLRATIASLTGQQQILSERVTELAPSVAASQTRLAHVLREAGLADIGALDQLRLSDEEATRLVVEQQRRTEAHTAAAMRLETLIRMRDGHAATRPDGTNETNETNGGNGAGLTELEATAKGAEARAALDAANRRLGALGVEVNIAQQALTSRRDLRARWERARTDAATWQRLHKLIGTGEGRAFQEFAQTLNLRELTARANTHLEQLCGRFELTVATNGDGQAELDFAIIDNAQGRKVRPVTTLSGGETFLVSLALALGLSDLSNRGFPIETLLLDEGFGALDAGALDDVLEVLEQLRHARHVQVGLISHVDAVRDRVGARIIVEPRGDGRSTVRVDHTAPLG